MKILLPLLLLCWAQVCPAKIWLPAHLSDHMVLQRNSTAKIYGWSTDTYRGEKITVTASWDQQPVAGVADQGRWQVLLSTPKAGGPHTITIQAHETIVINNVMIGEVWVCSGQSNMEWTPPQGLLNGEEEIRTANHPDIRFYFLPKHTADHPQDDSPGHWAACSPETMKQFSSVAYFFGRKLQRELQVPIGLIYTNWGGTPIETWIPEPLISRDHYLSAAAQKIGRHHMWPTEPGKTYNAMIHPLLKMDIAGAIWYQGESNRVNPFSYYRSFPLLIQSWRKAWQKDFPFYFVQIAPYKYDADDPFDAAIVRDAQRHTMETTAGTGMVVTTDVGDLQDIHPIDKKPVGERLANWALAKTYGKENIAFSGPLFSALETRPGQAIIYFQYADGGLIAQDGALTHFEVAGADRRFYPAQAVIQGSTVVVSSKEVRNPVAVRFAFSNTAEPNLFNAAGLPAVPFRTDDWLIEIK